ncbi:unnamed protein product [Didymodactylos carnosus]|uniref:VWFD domain-containing protein n=1 Tax=Didymodactylos carnosus TaxID=1234261 RepID=A0A814TP44_9BILA|nr:unnamed protein product [Didymodactylos carnosus]CAF3927663.1 unnamed protein product [Didymodactylos carnosus]
MTSTLCGNYFRKRPPSTTGKCENPTPPRPAGGNCDPHFTTLDSFNYTFNGYGEYTLIQTTDLQVQVRLEPVGAESASNRATAIMAFAIKNANFSTVQFELFPSLNTTEIRVNSRLLDLDQAPILPSTNNFDNDQLLLTKSNLTIYKITFANNISFIIHIREQYDFLNILALLPPHLQYQGLLGNMDMNRTNDLVFPNGTILDSDSSEQTIFEFGESWRTTEQTSIFYYLSNDKHANHQNATYRPTFTQELFQKHQNTSRFTTAEESCYHLKSTVTQRQCIYDILITNDATMSEMHTNFQSNIQEWKEFAEFVEFQSQLTTPDFAVITTNDEVTILMSTIPIATPLATMISEGVNVTAVNQLSTHSTAPIGHYNNRLFLVLSTLLFFYYI